MDEVEAIDLALCELLNGVGILIHAPRYAGR